MTFIGLNTEDASAQAERLDTGAQRLEELTEELGSAVARSSGFWIGADAEAFRASWGSTAQALRNATGDLTARGAELTQHREEQETASQNDGEPASSGSATGPSAQDGPNSPGEEAYYGEVDPAVAARWETMRPEDREAVAREIIESELARYGIEDVPIDFDLTDGNGLWSYNSEDGHSISINGDQLHTPRLLHTLAHEARHAAQWEATQATDGDSTFWDWLPGTQSDYERLENEHGFTREEVDSWREHWNTPKEDRAPYLDQSVEVDARNAGAEYSDELTLEDLHGYMDDAGVKHD